MSFVFLLLCKMKMWLWGNSYKTVSGYEWIAMDTFSKRKTKRIDNPHPTDYQTGVNKSAQLIDFEGRNGLQLPQYQVSNSETGWV